MFLVDGSGSIEFQGRGNFQRSKDFIKALINNFEVGRDLINIATVLYWDHFEIIHRLNTFYTKDEILNAIQGMRYPGGGTRTGQGLDVIRNSTLTNLGVRSQLTNIVVVVTDGLSQDSVSTPAKKLRDMGVIIISIGVGCCFYRPELNEMASDPDNTHVFDVAFRGLGTIVEPLSEQLCFGKLCLSSRSKYIPFQIVDKSYAIISSKKFLRPLRTANVSTLYDVTVANSSSKTKLTWPRLRYF